MERDNLRIDSRVAELVRQAEDILSEPEQVYDLVGRRFALRCIELKDYFSSETFRLGIVGNPNRGKTTLAYSYYQALETYRLPAIYFDLDIYSCSGLAISGQIDWKDRPKRPDAPREEVEKSILAFRNAGPGIVIGDFPGRIDNPYQNDRLKALDLVLILETSREERELWQNVASEAGVHYLWLRSQISRKLRYPLDPTIYGLNREPKPDDFDVLISLTRILEVVAKMKGVSLSSPWPFFTEAERMVLQEVLDFNFAPFSPEFTDFINRRTCEFRAIYGAEVKFEGTIPKENEWIWGPVMELILNSVSNRSKEDPNSGAKDVSVLFESGKLTVKDSYTYSNPEIIVDFLNGMISSGRYTTTKPKGIMGGAGIVSITEQLKDKGGSLTYYAENGTIVAVARWDESK